MRNNPLTAALGFVSITRIARSSTEIHSLVAETVATTSFSVTDGSWTQSIVKRFEQSGLICSLLTLDFVSLTLVFQESRGNREKRLGDMVVRGN